MTSASSSAMPADSMPSDGGAVDCPPGVPQPRRQVLDVCKRGMLLSSSRNHRVEPREFRVDMTWMTHHEMKSSANGESGLQLVGVRLPFLEGRGAGKAVVDGEPSSPRRGAEAGGQYVDDH